MEIEGLPWGWGGWGEGRGASHTCYTIYLTLLMEMCTSVTPPLTQEALSCAMQVWHLLAGRFTPAARVEVQASTQRVPSR